LDDMIMAVMQFKALESTVLSKFLCFSLAFPVYNKN
jgi:hypothetical protein